MSSWQWQDEQGQWETYDEAVQHVLTEAYSAALAGTRRWPQPPVQLAMILPASPLHSDSMQQTYEFDFTRRPMVQRNTDSGTERHIRLGLHAPAAARSLPMARLIVPEPEPETESDDAGGAAADASWLPGFEPPQGLVAEEVVAAVDVKGEDEPSRVREELVEIYMCVEPEKVVHVDRLMSEWAAEAGGIRELLERVRTKYAGRTDGGGESATTKSAKEPPVASAPEVSGDLQVALVDEMEGRQEAVRVLHGVACKFSGLRMKSPVSICIPMQLGLDVRDSDAACGLQEQLFAMFDADQVRASATAPPFSLAETFCPDLIHVYVFLTGCLNCYHNRMVCSARASTRPTCAAPGCGLPATKMKRGGMTG